MDLDPDAAATRGLRHYVRLVAKALGLSGEEWTVQLDHPVTVYLAIEQRLPACPDHDVALFWHEHHGWSLALESFGGKELVMIAHLGPDLLPAPDVVAETVTRLLADITRPQRIEPPRLDAADPTDLPRRLADYAMPAANGVARLPAKRP